MFWGLFVFPGHSTRERQSSVMTIQQGDVLYSADPHKKTALAAPIKTGLGEEKALEELQR